MRDQTDTEQPNDEPEWPPPTLEGEWIELPGFEDVAERPEERRYPG